MITKTKSKTTDTGMSVGTAYLNKQILLQIARKGENRPKDKTKLGGRLYAYTKNTNTSYDKNFHSAIKKLRPDWFISSATLKKNELIKIAKKGEARPTQKTKLGCALCLYVNKSSKVYDCDFAVKIKNLRPDWFFDTKQNKQKQLLDIATRGLCKPKPKTLLAQALSSYINKTGSAYTPEFSEKIRKLRPEWFFSNVEIANKKKEKLIHIAKTGKKVPKTGSILHRALREYTYTSSKSFDESFAKNIKNLRPEWFVSVKEIVKQKKEKIIEFAKNGNQRPKKRTSMGSCLKNYTSASSSVYDKHFTQKIKELRPDWFKKL